MLFPVRLIFAAAFLVACDFGAPPQPSAQTAPAAPGRPGVQETQVPATVTIEASQGQVLLPHFAHARRFHCATCHSEVEPGKIAWEKAAAHAYCRDCHETEGGGPTACTACHRK